MPSKRTYPDYKLKDVLIIGVSQALAAAFPGVSRSGVTITSSRALEYDRTSSARLSFILSIPMILAAVVVSLKDFSFANPIPFFIGIATSFVVGLIVVSSLMKYLKNGNYKAFAIYRFIFGILLIGVVIAKSFIL
jgi:undecaprenyl-diphosphatase